MPLPPYNQLLQNLNNLVKAYPWLVSTLQPVIDYLIATADVYDQWVLYKMDNLDDEDEDEYY